MSETNDHPGEQQLAYVEALATWSTRYRDPSGFECVLSIQAETGAAVLQKAEGALSHLTANECLPLPTNNGHQAQPIKPAPEEHDEPEDKAFCAQHQVTMKRRSKEGKVWYSHRLPDGSWCNGGEG